MSFLKAIILAIIEGITEFLPISSTGHMIIGSSMMGIASDPFTKTFMVAIQFGAILSVVILYWKRFFKSLRFYYLLFIAFLPAAIFGFLLNDYVDQLLESIVVVAWMLILGGIVFLFIDKHFAEKEARDEDPSVKQALGIGLFQVVSMVPGVSRSAATIIGGLFQGLSRKAAAEFSFLLAVPTMFAATVYKLYKLYSSGVQFGTEEVQYLVLGNVVAFIFALLSIRSFIQYLQKHGFKFFGIYRIVVGAIILLLYYLGYPLQII